MSTLSTPPIVVGFAFLKKKVETMRDVLEGDAAVKQNHRRIVWKAIDLDLLDAGRPLAEQGPFDILVHKLSDDVRICADRGSAWLRGGSVASNAKGLNDDSASARRIRALQAYCAAHPTVPLVDPPVSVANVVSRVATCRILAELHGTPIGRVVDIGASPRDSIEQKDSSDSGSSRDSDGDGSLNGWWQPLLVAPRYVVAADGVRPDDAAAVGSIRAALLNTLCTPGEETSEDLIPASTAGSVVTNYSWR